jgi:hypothetical protein
MEKRAVGKSTYFARLCQHAASKIEDLLIADCGFIDSENLAFTVAPLARDGSPTINPQSAIRNPQSAIRNPKSEGLLSQSINPHGVLVK